jgi:ribose transport system ATP-binding protein
LSETEVEELFETIRHLKNNGMGIIYITHRLEELKEISDRITVMRNGQYIDTLDTREATLDRIISLMVGREIYQTSKRSSEKEDEEVVLEVRNLNRGRVIKNVSFKLKRGEILGFAGLLGAGRTEVARAIFGADPIDSGEIYIKGRRVHIKSPTDAVKHGIGYLSEDRKRYGLMLGLDVEDNIVIATLERFLGRLGWVKRSKTSEEARMRVDELDIKTPSLQQKVKYLSGGTQQKVVVAKWLTRNCDILIFDEPTRGIDVGAKSEIYKLLNELAESGKSIIMISSELPEILRMSHRIIVMCEGRITGELMAEEATQERIMQYATMRTNSVISPSSRR